ncbi:snRNA-activating protein complex subunit 2 [Brachionichthys hirsutus]|uniref:snRNA-activating protein complex subunit 2 n=1 Tax=Brachionichthys hirsutus TaxID=412623 RepID=UPI0036051482
MKPPPRKRSRPAPVLRSGSLVAAWRRAELVQLLGAVKTLRRAGGGNADLDYAALQRSVPTRSASEVQALIEALRDKVISRASYELRRTRWKENKARKPIELWTRMASVVAGTLVEPVSVAFSRMLVVSSIEPRTLKNNDPPQIHKLPTDPHLPARRTIPFRPMPRSLNQGEQPGSRARPQVVQTPAASRSPVGGHLNVPPPQKQLPASPTSLTSVFKARASSSSSSSSCPLASCHSTPPISSPAATVQSQFGRTSKHSTKDSPRVLGVRCVVDFERIYRYLSAIHKQNEECHLTPMESAIVLDLLMSLPEEIRLLDCSKLHKHLLKVYQCLSFPADSKASRETFQDLKDRLGQLSTGSAPQQNAAGSAHSSGLTEVKNLQPEKAQSKNTSSQSEGLTEPCLPLNPFLIPLDLLVRR